MASYEQLNTIVMQQHNNNEYSDKHKTPHQFDFQGWTLHNKGQQLIMNKWKWETLWKQFEIFSNETLTDLNYTNNYPSSTRVINMKIFPFTNSRMGEHHD